MISNVHTEKWEERVNIIVTLFTKTRSIIAIYDSYAFHVIFSMKFEDTFTEFEPEEMLAKSHSRIRSK